MRHLLVIGLLLTSMLTYADKPVKRLSPAEVKKMQEKVAATPTNTFRFVGNALICKSSQGENYYACHRIGNLRIGDPYKPKEKPWKDIQQEGEIVASVFPIVANKEHEAYWVIGHKDGIIESVQITGNYPHKKLAFSTIMLGDPDTKVKEILGPRYRERKVDSINGVIWDYYPFPISIELVGKKVYSVRVTRDKPPKKQ